MARRPRRETVDAQRFRRRSLFVLGGFVIATVVLCVRAVELQVIDNAFLTAEGDARHIRRAEIAAHRGPIVDRHGEPLAVSTPVDSVWANPRELTVAIERLPELARALERDPQWLARQLTSNTHREFLYLRRHMRPDQAARVMALQLPGVHLQREYRRYYPAGEVSGHLLGFTNIDDRGQEGLELAFDPWLRGEPGVKRVLRDRFGRVIEHVESVRPARPGRTLRTSIDLRLQYLAYRELKAAVARHDAISGSAVVLDVRTGEVLAIVNQPAYNPNDRSQFAVDRYRNRAATDIFEPGSAFKPLIVAAALESGRYRADAWVDTAPGFTQVGARRIEDRRNLGRIDLTTLMAQSSNVGAVRVAMDLEPLEMWQVLDRFGLGRPTSSGFPGESAGLLHHHTLWRPVGQATMAFGYGLSMTTLQLAQAYALIGAGGVARGISLVALDEAPAGERLLSAETAAAVMQMMEAVVTPAGTGNRAAVQGYSVAGKTGTARKAVAGGYSETRHLSLFAGLAPASDPRLAVAVVIDEPRAGGFYGGEVAAPVFGQIVSDALRLLAVPPDQLPAQDSQRIIRAGVGP
ncbi:MAG: penicillin-binding protein 2 [Gammaproteobacteria bacterium]|nr:penicillin-binding protein 2 [Gammaproteobacteria bacterium]TVQ47079.1 MAG: penicillin-binding protein 2 [Gammaproteobacteria bacterium]